MGYLSSDHDEREAARVPGLLAEIQSLKGSLTDCAKTIDALKRDAAAAEHRCEEASHILDPRVPPEFPGRSVQWVAQRRMDQIKALTIMVDEFKKMLADGGQKDDLATTVSPGVATCVKMVFEDHEGERCAVIRVPGQTVRIKGIKSIEIEGSPVQ